MKRIKIIRVLATYICHDPFAYSPIWTWDGFPPIIYTERERILPVLKEWEHKGYLTLIYDEKIGRIQRANALRRKVIKSFRKNTQKEYKNLIFLLV